MRNVINLPVGIPLLLLALSACKAGPTTDPGEMEARASVADLSSPDPEKRLQAIELARVSSPEIIQAVGRLLPDARPEVVQAAERALWNISHSCTSGEGPRRKQTTGALLRLLDEGKTLPTVRKATILRMLAITTQGAEHSRALAAFLQDKELADPALFALTRISNSAAEQILVTYLDRPSALPRAAYARALGERRSTRAVDALLLHARKSESTTAETAQAVRHALARIADPKAQKVLRKAAEDKLAGAQHALLEFLESSESCANDRENNYRLLYGSPAAEIRTAAIEGLARMGGGDYFDLFLGVLADDSPLVVEAGSAALVGLRGEEVSKKLAARIDRKKPKVHARLLRILTQRGAESAYGLVREAADSSSGLVHLTALELFGEFDKTDLEPVLVMATKEPEPEFRRAAAESLFRHAERRLKKKQEESALDLLHHVLLATAKGRTISKALAEIARIGSHTSLPHLESLAKHKDHVEDIARARLAIARAMADGDPKQATEILLEVCDYSQSKSTRSQAATELEELGYDTSVLVRRGGFIDSWFVKGGFPPSTKKNMGSHPFAESGSVLLDLPLEKSGWRVMLPTGLDGSIDLTKLEKKQKVTAYAARDVLWDKEEELTLKVGSDDGVAIWLNGKRVHQNFTQRGVRIDQDKVQVRFRKGKNRILVKIHQGGGSWGFCVRLADAKGKPIDLSTHK